MTAWPMLLKLKIDTQDSRVWKEIHIPNHEQEGDTKNSGVRHYEGSKCIVFLYTKIMAAKSSGASSYRIIST